jgi:HAD superfamily hydrolase (TIGR01509 family)
MSGQGSAVLRAIIFDFDGVIADDEPLHLASFQRAFAECGSTLDQQAYYERYLGFDDRECVRHVLSDQGRHLPEHVIDTIGSRKQKAFLQAIRTGAPLFRGVADFVRRAAASHPLAIASGALRHEIELILTAAGLRECFRVIVSADDTSVGKPDPRVFRLALSGLNAIGADAPIEPHECLVIEDSVAGVEGAHRAGMRCLAVTNSYGAAQLGGATLVVSSLEGLQLRDLEALFDR